MRRRSTKPTGSGKLLDAWTPPEDAGDPLGCVATTFTFRAEFFEEECLGRFLQLETDPAEDGPAYIIEREDKLAQLGCAIVLIDQHHARNLSRSLRWDVLVARPAQGIQHAKISLLLWSNRARLIVASANLTEDGYRRNLETFGVLDYHEGCSTPLEVLDACLSFLRDAAATADQNGAATARWDQFLSQVSRRTKEWGSDQPPRGSAHVRVFPVLSGPGRRSVFETLEELKAQTSALTDAYVVSPFFDPPEAPNKPAHDIWKLLKQRGGAEVHYHVIVEDVPGRTAVLVWAPKSLLAARPEATSISQLMAKSGDSVGDCYLIPLQSDRPLHAKCLSLENDRSILRVIGSSNFTSAGLGLGKIKNWEANLAYLVHREANPVAEHALDLAWPCFEELPHGLEQLYQSPKNEDESGDETVMLPRAFGEAVVAHTDSGLEIRLHIQGVPPTGWQLFPEQERALFTCEDAWQAQGSPGTYSLPWRRDRLPDGFSVRWSGCPCAAWWPVNALDAAALPPPAELKNLNLETLIHLLTSARPLHVVLTPWLKRQSETSAAGISAERLLDPHQRVDTSAFLLQRTRRVSAALHGMRQRLERPFVSEAVLHWRLRGPVGVIALADAITREAGSEVERAFLLLELCLELRRVRPQPAPSDCLDTKQVRSSLRKLTTELRQKIPTDVLESDRALASYARAALKEVDT